MRNASNRRSSTDYSSINSGSTVSEKPSEYDDKNIKRGTGSSTLATEIFRESGDTIVSTSVHEEESSQNDNNKFLSIPNSTPQKAVVEKHRSSTRESELTLLSDKDSRIITSGDGGRGQTSHLNPYETTANSATVHENGRSNENDVTVYENDSPREVSTNFDHRGTTKLLNTG